MPQASAPSAHDPAKDSNALKAAGNDLPRGLWSDGATMWVVDRRDEKVYAYDMSTRTRDPAKDFNTLSAAGNTWPSGIWSDGTTMWVTDTIDDKIYAYDMTTGARDPAEDFDSLDDDNGTPTGLWSDGVIMWVSDFHVHKVFAYDLTEKARVPTRDFAINYDHLWLTGIWSDGVTMWMTYNFWTDDAAEAALYAYDMTTKARDPSRDFNALRSAGNHDPTGIWSDGTTMWVADISEDKIYAYVMPSGDGPPDPGTSGAPRIRLVTSSGSGLSIAWNARPGGGSTVTSYDLRHIRSDAPDRADANWTVVEDVWTPGSGPLSFELTGLTSGVQYDVQVRAVVGAANGPWSATSTGTPLARTQVNADFNGDGIVNFADFFDFVDAFGTSDAKYDLDNNGIVNFADFFEFVDAFGTSG